MDTFQCLHKPLAGCLISYLISVSTTITHQFHCCSVACIRSNTQRTTDKHHQLSPLFISDNFVSKLRSGIEWRWPPPTTDPPTRHFSLSLFLSLSHFVLPSQLVIPSPGSFFSYPSGPSICQSR